jgi:hypothetical protein
MSIHEKLSLIQTSLKAPKEQTNAFGNYKYRSCEDILNAVKPFLGEHNLTLVISDEMVMLGDRFYVKATARISDGEEVIYNTAFAREAESKKGMDESQITGACSSYARKYCLNGLFAIDDTKDADSTNNHEDAKEVGLADKAKEALEKGDWAELCALDKQDGWLDAWKLLDSRKRKSIKELMGRRNEYRDALAIRVEDEDPDGTLEVWNEMSKPEKAEVWRCLQDETKEFITKLKEVK